MKAYRGTSPPASRRATLFAVLVSPCGRLMNRPIRALLRFRLTGVLVAAILWLPLQGRAGERVLPPNVGPRLEAALDAADGPTRLKGAAIQRDRVGGTVCLASAATVCARFRLTDPLPACADTLAGPWCLSWPEGAAAQLKTAVAGRLAKGFAATTWQAPAAARDVSRPITATEADVECPRPPAKTGVSGLAVLLGLFFAAWVLARLVVALLARRIRPRWLVAGLMAVLVVEPVHANLSWLLVGVWDATLVGLLLAAGALFGGLQATGRLRWRGLLLATMAALVAGVVAEGGARLAGLGPAQGVGASGGLLLSEEVRDRALAQYGHGTDLWQERACQLLFDADLQQARFTAAAAEATDGNVLHLGDSMTWGLGVPAEDRFTAILNVGIGPRHVNAAMPATGPDFHVAMAERLLARRTPRLLVLHLFAGNDLEELDRPYGCCAGGSLYSSGAGALQLRCPEADWRAGERGRLAWLGAHSPAPLLLRATAGWSAVAAAGQRAFLTLSHRLGGSANGGETAWRRLYALLDHLAEDMRARQVPVLLVVHPARADLVAGKGERDNRRVFGDRLLARAGALGWAAFDLQPTLETLLQEGGVAQWFLDQGPDDPHYTVAAHKRVAAALRAPIAGALARSAADK